ncbi:MAG: HAD family phosphatase [Dysgonamonadaceae bacterium]|jgi:HAD superfamily hydrolase (TIGR01509 family)|nr:HAD family phosphatase [Dysgonamonadaceae bacterium]
MKNNIAALFDLDGVIIDTESQYDIFWREIGQKYQLGIENIEQFVKGTTLSNIMSTYFSYLPVKEQEKLETVLRNFELQMDMIPIPGALEFLAELKRSEIKMGLVTSSDDEKLDYIFRSLPIRTYFDTLVTANRVIKGKPDPACYLLAASDLHVLPENCYVFEDSFNGIAAGNAAGMKVIGLSTTNSTESIRDKVIKVIPDFRGFSL